MNVTKAITSYFIKKTGTFFLVDSSEAMLTALFLLVLKRFGEYVGIPPTKLTFLSTIAPCICLFSAACFVLIKKNHAPFLKVINIANFIYCISTMVVLIVCYVQLTTIGLIYFLAEMTIIDWLASIELKLARMMTNKPIP